MLPISLRILRLLGRGRQRRGHRQKSAYRKLQFELLEDRLTPSTSGFASPALSVVSGMVFVDNNNNGVRDPGELVAPGARVTLSGTTLLGAPVNVSATTDANGQFVFFQVQPGSYGLSPGSGSYLGGQAGVGNLGGDVGGSTTSSIFVGEGQAAINYNRAVRGLAPSAISLRDFLSSSTSSSFFPSAGSGNAAADNSVQPSSAATVGTSSLSGSVSNGNVGVQGAQITLTGIDMTGRAIATSTTTDAIGAYHFAGLQAGTYALNLSGQPAGLRSGQPTLGSAGGQAVLNTEINDIQLAAGTSGTAYNFTETPLPTPVNNDGVTLTAGLADDTAGPGGSTSDGITSDPSILGTASGSGSPVTLHAGFDSAPATSFVDISSLVGSGGSFFINESQLFQISGGTLLTSAFHTLHLQATDNQGQVASFDVPYTIQNAAPTLHLDSASDHGMGVTTNSVVTLQGQTSAGVQVTLIQNGTTLGTTTSDSTGAFSFANIGQTPGANKYTVVDNAGNSSQFQTFLVSETGPVGATSAVPETAQLNSQNPADTFVDLSTSNLFTDGNFSNSLVRANTSAGPINLELFDAGAPGTVANFFDYINMQAYNNDIFHRLATNPDGSLFVLQGGGFTFDPSTHTFPAVAAGPTIPNEFDNMNRPNVLGTIAMAKFGNNADSATSQFFFNLGDNTVTLGSQNAGGFTSFGRVLSGADQRVLNTLAAATVTNESSTNGAFDTLPLNNFSGTFPADTTAANYDLINNIQVLRRTDHLTFSFMNSSNPNVATGSINTNFGQLDIHPVAAGTTNITVQAMDNFGHTATVTLSVTVQAA
jgi:cyclophilin family peptidyl-prolyl cis-trans isomerase